jgi:hypothetical protein
VPNEHLVTYLNDHLAGATGAIDLMEHTEAAHPAAPIGPLLGRIRAEVIADRQQLEAVIARVGANQSGVRKAAAWFGERLSQLKLAVDDPANGALRLFESLEALSLGIEGKKTLWRTLSASAATVPALQGFDYDTLIRRADEQRAALEPARMSAAKAAFA